MKTITKYIAYDKSEFTDEAACLEYERKCRIADDIISGLRTRPEGCDFSNGTGYIQHDPETFKTVRRELVEQANTEYPHKWLQAELDGQEVHPSWAARIIGECCTDRLYKAWYRILCTDSKFREWGQPYYAEHPEEAKQIAL